MDPLSGSSAEALSEPRGLSELCYSVDFQTTLKACTIDKRRSSSIGSQGSKYHIQGATDQWSPAVQLAAAQPTEPPRTDKSLCILGGLPGVWKRRNGRPAHCGSVESGRQLAISAGQLGQR